jgi:hypothetical protein
MRVFDPYLNKYVHAFAVGGDFFWVAPAAEKNYPALDWLDRRRVIRGYGLTGIFTVSKRCWVRQKI